MEKEQWKDDILRSIEGAKRAEPGPFLFDNIREKIGSAGRMQVVRRPYLALAAACLALLLAANIRAMRQSNGETSAHSIYQVDNTNFELY